MPLLLIPTQVVRSATWYWDGGTTNIATNGNGSSAGGDGNWSTAIANWDQGNGLAHVAWSNGTNTASFAGTANTPQVTLITPITLGGLSINTKTYTIIGDSTNRLSFSGSAVSINASTAVNSIISAPITTEASSVLSINGGGSSANNALSINGNNTIQGSVSIISSTKILLANNNALAGATGITVSSGSSLGISNGVTASGVTATISGRTTNTPGGSAIQSSGTATWAGNVVLAADASFGARAGTLTISGNISESGGSRVLFIDPNTDIYGSDVVQLSGTNTYTGGTRIANAGTYAGILSYLTTAAKPTTGTTTVGSGAVLALGVGEAGFTSADIDSLFANTLSNVSLDATSRVGIDTTPGDYTYSSSVSSARGLVKVGGNALTLSGNNTYTGSTTVWNGTLKLGSASSLGDGTTNTSGVAINNGATLDLNGFSPTATVGLTLNGTGVSTLGALVNNSATATTYGGLIILGSSSSIIASGGDISLSNTGTIIGSGFGLTVGGAKNTTISGIIGTGAGTVTKQDSGKLTLTGANTYTGTTSISGGTLINGSATTFTAKGALSLSSTGTFDLGGYNASVTSITAGASTNTITNNGTSAATLNLSAQTNVSVGLLFTDGASATAVSIANPNLAVNAFTNTNNSFSGGLTLLHSGSGTRLSIGSLTVTGVPGAITKGNYGTGSITLGQSATDKASIFFTSSNNMNLKNAVTVNTALGSDRFGIRVDTSATQLSGTLTANLADAVFSSNAPASSDVSLTGQVTGPKGLILDVSQSTGAATSFTVKLNNATTNPNNYQGDTIINRTGQAGKSATLSLGAANQIPNGVNAGNVTVNGSLGTGTFNLAGYDETVNGLGGSGVVDNLTAVNANNTLTIGDNDATGLNFSGTIRNTAGVLAITKIGTGTQTLSGTIAYSGNTTVSAGTLSLAQANTLNEQSTVSIVSGAVLNLTFNGTDTVDKLFLNGIQQNSGIYDSSNSNGLITGTGSLQVTTGPASGYTTWITRTFANGQVPVDKRGSSDDSDNDGVNNLLEFVLNGDPTVSDNSILPVPNVTANNLEFTYQRRDDSVSPETTQTFEWSSTLTDWPGSVVVPTYSESVPPATITISPGLPDNAVTDTVKISIPKSEAGADTKLFGRLKVVKP